ncbi:hypothetical protein Cfor_04741 [Coptotermes formosanus]|uniref:Uncharacterized protein n=1 Tax=Coptotermes formosanus TaxID=36987 RepID=A0A6L2PJR3_COPFO|nr:hypothetical protein Cfor_04741 [Coptotermes formosanus]
MKLKTANHCLFGIDPCAFVAYHHRWLTRQPRCYRSFPQGCVEDGAIETCTHFRQEGLFPQLQEDFDDFILQQDGVPPQLHREVQKFLNETYHGLGLGVLSKILTCLWKSGHPDPQTPHMRFFSSGDMSRASFCYYPFRATLRNRRNASWLPCQPSKAIRYKGSGMNGTRGLTCAM